MRVFLIVACLACCLTVHADESVEERVNALLAPFDQSTPGVVIGVVREGELVFSRAAGLANLTFAVPFDEDTPTNIGSTAKQFTGLALALLHTRGALSLDDDVRDYLPDLPDFGQPVTLRHLANHTSGYREFLNALALAGRALEHGDWIEADEAVALIKNQPTLQNVPGAEWNYNNTGYVLLGRVIAEVTGQSFEAWLEEEIFGQLGMSATRVRRDPRQVIPGASTGYAKSDGEHVEVRDIGGAPGAGGVYTTVADMGRWMRHLSTFELGGDEVRSLMTTPATLENGESTNYGLGLVIDEWHGLQRWQHGGGDIGHASAFFYFPEIDSGYMVFANHHGLNAGFLDSVAEIFFGEHIESDSHDEAAEAVPGLALADEFHDELFDRYSGSYELEVMPGFILRFFRDGERYMTQATGQPALEITPQSADTFVIDVVDARIVFHADEGAAAHELTLFQNGEHRAVRVPEEGGETIELDDYIGRYFSSELETFYTIAVEEDRLRLHHRRFGPIDLYPADDDQFNGSFPVTTIAFQRNEEGRVTALKAGNVRARDVRFDRVD